MAINVNIETQRLVPQVNNAGLTLVILRYAQPIDDIGLGTTFRIDGYDLETLENSFKSPSGETNEEKEAAELFSLEYLVSAGVNVLCYAVLSASSNAIAADDIDNIKDRETLNYKFILSPHNFVSYDDETKLSVIPTLLTELVGGDPALPEDIGIEAQLFLDLDPKVDIAAVETNIIADIQNSPKIEIFFNTGFVEYGSRFDSVLDTSVVDGVEVWESGKPYELDDIVLYESIYYQASASVASTTPPPDDAENWAVITSDAAGDSGYYGIPASHAATIRKTKFLENGTPWIPVAGEQNSAIGEFIDVYKDLTTNDKNTLQAANINVLVSKVNFGPLFVSQNTMSGTTGPLVRSHVVTEALYIKRFLESLAESVLFLPNNQKTWNSIRLKVDSKMDEILNQEGIEEYNVAVGEGITMTEQDIVDGKLIVKLDYVPIRVIEDITFNVVINETVGIYDIDISGGAI